MISSQFSKRTVSMISAALTLTSCNAKRSDLPSLAPATTVVVTDYTAVTTKKPDDISVWTVTNPQKVARLAQLADAQRTGWRDANAAILSKQSGISMKLSGAGVNQIFTIQPDGFNNSYNTASGNLWSRPDSVGPITLIKELPDAELDKLIADIRAVVKDVKPDATPTPATTSSPSKSANDKIKSKGQR